MVSNFINESGMKFKTDPQDHFFHIEKSRSYQDISEGIKIAEFVYLRNVRNKSVINFIEAKLTPPHPENNERFEEFIEEITSKFINSFSIYIAGVPGRHKYAVSEIPKALRVIDFSLIDFSFILVIKEAEDAWLPDIKDAIDIKMRALIKTWSISSDAVLILNYQLAFKKGMLI
jgi:hypothetical protein